MEGRNCLVIEGVPEEVDGRHLALEDGVWSGGWRGAQETLVVHLKDVGTLEVKALETNYTLLCTLGMGTQLFG